MLVVLILHAATSENVAYHSQLDVCEYNPDSNKYFVPLTELRE